MRGATGSFWPSMTRGKLCRQQWMIALRVLSTWYSLALQTHEHLLLLSPVKDESFSEEALGAVFNQLYDATCKTLRRCGAAAGGMYLLSTPGHGHALNLLCACGPNVAAICATSMDDAYVCLLVDISRGRVGLLHEISAAARVHNATYTVPW